MTRANEPVAIRISTRNLPPHDRMEILRETYGRTVMRSEIAPLGEGPAYFEMNLFAAPGLGMASGRCSPLSSHRTTALIDNDDLVLLVALEGSTVMRHRGREERIANGEALLMKNDEVGFNRMESDFRCLNLSIPHALLAPMIGDPAHVLMRPISPTSEALRLLVRYAGALHGMMAAAPADLRRLIIAHVHDLAALAIGATRDAAEIASGRGVRAARLRAIKADIADRLGRDEISSATLAARHHISERYLRKLFALEGASLSDFVLGLQLLRAHRMLTDPRLSGRTISAIAYEAGFNDLSYFNRAFRRRYAATPSDIRALAARPNRG